MNTENPNQRTFGNIVKALAAARLEFETIVKSTPNPFYNNKKYADLEAIISATVKPLAKHGLVIVQSANLIEGTRTIRVETLLIHESGEFFQNFLDIPADKQSKFDAQTIGSAMTYGRRYSYQSILNLAAEDDDGNSLTESPKESKPSRFDSNRKGPEGTGKYTPNIKFKKPESEPEPPQSDLTEPEEPEVNELDQHLGVEPTQVKHPLPTPEQLKEFGSRLKEFKQDSRVLKNYLERTAGVAWKEITTFQFNNILATLIKAEQNGGSDAVTALITKE